LIQLTLDKQATEKLQNLTGAAVYNFLGFTLNFKEHTLTDNLNSELMKNWTEWHIQLLTTLLCHHSQGNPTPPTGKLIKFKEIPGGYAYENAFDKRAIQPIADFFGETPKMLPQAAKLLGGKQLTIAADASTEIPALKGIPLTYILWGADEFAASANILYDQTASCYLPTEDLAVLGEITTSRLITAKNKITSFLG
jgi:hypothetical protein